MNQSKVGWIIGALAVGGLATAQLVQMSQFRAELSALRAEVQGVASTVPTSVDQGSKNSPPVDRTAGFHARLANLERAVADFSKASEALADRGMVPPTEERLAQLLQRFTDPNASEADRLRALRSLKRGQNQLSDEVVTHAMSMLQSSTNANSRRQLLQQLDGVTNAAMKQPLIAMLGTETSGNVREELIDVLSDFASDPAVEGKLWELALNDSDGEVREEAQEALTEGPMTPERAQKLRETAMSSDASVDERLLSMRALREAGPLSPEVISEMTNLAQNNTDPVTRAKLFSAFDGINDPNLMPTLVNGLQDPNPVVRENAADALSSFSADPRIQEWLNHVINTDADPRVKREAMQALQQSQGGGGGGRRGGR
jgi:HEAT repeat protein